MDEVDFSMFIDNGSLSEFSDIMYDSENKKNSQKIITIVDKCTRSPKEVTIAEKVTRSRQPSSTSRKKAVATSVTEKAKVTKTSDLEALLSQFNLPNHWIRVIPSFKIRENEPNIRASSSKASFGRLVSLSTQLLETSLKIICPGPGYDEFKSYVLSKLVQKNYKMMRHKLKIPTKIPKCINTYVLN